MNSDNINQSTGNSKYPVNPLDFSTDLFCSFSDQIIHLVIHLDGRMNIEILKKVIEDISRKEPIITCRITRDMDSLWWEKNTDNNFWDPFIVLSGNPEELLYQAVTSPLDPYSGRLFQVILIKNLMEDKDILVINVHHILMDGRGLMAFTGQIISLYQNYMNGNIPAFHVTPISARLMPMISDLVNPGNNRLSTDPSSGWSSKISVPVNSFNYECYVYSVLTLSPERTEIINSFRKEWGITVNDLMIAVIARAITFALNESSNTTVPLHTTIDLRRYLSEKPECLFVNYSTSFEVRVNVNPDESLKETGINVHHMMNKIKNENPGVYEAIDAENLSNKGYTKARELLKQQYDNIRETGNKTVIFSNTGIIDKDLINPGNPSVEKAYILPSFFKPPGFFFLLSTYDNTMTLTAAYALPAYDPALISQIFSYIESIIPGYENYPGTFNLIN